MAKGRKIGFYDGSSAHRINPWPLPDIASQLIKSSCSMVAPPGTMVIGTRSRAAGLPVRYEISGPGPSGPVPAASTRIDMLGSSLINGDASSTKRPEVANVGELVDPDQ